MRLSAMKKQTQFKPNFCKAQNERKRFFTKDYENETAFRLRKNKPNSNPVLSAVEWANFKPPRNEPKKLKRKRGPQELFCGSGLTERLTF